MRNRAEPVPESVSYRRPHHDLAGGAGEVDGGLVGIVEFETMKWPVAGRTPKCELVERYLLMVSNRRGSPNHAWNGLEHDLARSVRIDWYARAMGEAEQEVR